jgi:hypothetical protein
MAEQQPPIRTGFWIFSEKAKVVSLLYLCIKEIILGQQEKKWLNILRI